MLLSFVFVLKIFLTTVISALYTIIVFINVYDFLYQYCGCYFYICYIIIFVIVLCAFVICISFCFENVSK